MNHPLATIVASKPLRAHAKPYDAHRNAQRRPSTRTPKHARTTPTPWPSPLTDGWQPTRGRHAHPYNFAYEQLQIELGLGTSTGKHATTAPSGAAA